MDLGERMDLLTHAFEREDVDQALTQSTLFEDRRLSREVGHARLRPNGARNGQPATTATIRRRVNPVGPT